jgi:hypothetical protein
MTGPAPAPGGPPACDDLTPCLFRALFQGFDLHQVGGTYVVLPKGTPCLFGPSLGAIARQISAPEPAPGPDAAGPAR